MVTTTIQDRKFIGYLLCAVTFAVIVVNLIQLSKSISWQMGFRIRRKANMTMRAASSDNARVNEKKVIQNKKNHNNRWNNKIHSDYNSHSLSKIN